jgi:putative FmdB family regulatory protein
VALTGRWPRDGTVAPSLIRGAPLPPPGWKPPHVPVYEYRCADCGEQTDRLLPHPRANEPGPCPVCAGTLERRFSRVAVKLEGWGFSRNDGMVPDRPGGRGDFKQVRERAERISDGGT